MDRAEIQNSKKQLFQGEKLQFIYGTFNSKQKYVSIRKYDEAGFNYKITMFDGINHEAVVIGSLDQSAEMYVMLKNQLQQND